MNLASSRANKLLDELAARQRQEEQAASWQRTDEGQPYVMRSGRMIVAAPFEGDEDAYRCFEAKSEDASMSLALDYAVQRAGEPSRAELSNVRSAAPQSFPGSCVAMPGDDGARQIAKLQKKLAQQLGPEYISHRQGPAGAGKLYYLEGWKAIDLANETFGFNGWSSTIVRLDVDYIDETEAKKFNVGVSSIIRITLRDGTFHEDVGSGSADNYKGKGQALELAKKEAVTDGTKRALRNFGRLLGNCLYDKRFLSNTANVKAQVPKFDPSNLKRGPEAADVNLAGHHTKEIAPPMQRPAQRQEAPAAAPNATDACAQTVEAPEPAPEVLYPSAAAEFRQSALEIQQQKNDERQERLAQAAARKAELLRRSSKVESSVPRIKAPSTFEHSVQAERDPLATKTANLFDAGTSRSPPMELSEGIAWGSRKSEEEDEFDADLAEITASQIDALPDILPTSSTTTSTDTMGTGHSSARACSSAYGRPSAMGRMLPLISPTRPRLVNVKREEPMMELGTGDVYKRARQK